MKYYSLNDTLVKRNHELKEALEDLDKNFCLNKDKPYCEARCEYLSRAIFMRGKNIGS